MKTSRSLLIVTAVVLLGGCASHHHDRHHGGQRMHFNPMVSVKGGVVSVSPEPLVFLKGEQGPVQWRLPPGLRFEEKGGITIEGELFDPDAKDPKARLSPNVIKYGRSLKPQNEITDCAIADEGRSFRCANKNTRAGVYRYTIRLRDDKGNRFEWDPTVMNND